MADQDDGEGVLESNDPRVTGAAGGDARAKSMSPEARRTAASIAARARWGAPLETFSGDLELIPGLVLPCSVLDNGVRVLSTRGVSRAFGSKKTGTDTTGTGAPQPPPFLASAAIKPYLSEKLIALLNSPVVYRRKVGGRTGHGYDCAIFPMICKAIIAAERDGSLRAQQKPMADAAHAMLDALVGVAMIALVDEATGYQAVRARDELQITLKKYVVEDMLKWVPRFPEEFFKQIYRLQNWKYKEGCAKLPGYVGTIINEWIYGRLPEPVLPKLRDLNPRVNSNRRAKHHQFLTEHTGIPHLDAQITAVTMLMRAAPDRRLFDVLLRNAFPLRGDQLSLAAVEATEP